MTKVYWLPEFPHRRRTVHFHDPRNLTPEFVDAFYRIAQDRGEQDRNPDGPQAGKFHYRRFAWSSFGDVTDPGVWSQVHDEGRSGFGKNHSNIRVPVIAAIEG